MSCDRSGWAHGLDAASSPTPEEARGAADLAQTQPQISGSSDGYTFQIW